MSSETEALQARESLSLSRQPAIGRKSTAEDKKVNDCGFDNQEEEESLKQTQETEKLKVELSAFKDELSRKRADLQAAEKRRARAEGELTTLMDNYEEILARRLREGENEQTREGDLEYQRKQRFVGSCCHRFFSSTRVIVGKKM